MLPEIWLPTWTFTTGFKRAGRRDRLRDRARASPPRFDSSRRPPPLPAKAQTADEEHDHEADDKSERRFIDSRVAWTEAATGVNR